ncbi:MAG: hypothetical protein WC462_02135 [archaeon]
MDKEQVKRATVFLIIAVLLVGTFFSSGCVLSGTSTSDDTNAKITNDADVQKALNDAGTDISGINNSLSEIDQNLSQ